jgi:Domain of unknown function DUF11/RTX calcium-binding nonapeptide repeat (4 copies)
VLLRKNVVAMVVLGSTLLAVAPPAPAAVHYVANASEFNSALGRAQGGDTISLADGQWPNLQVANKHMASPVRITGSRAARLTRLDFAKSSNFIVSGFTLTPTDEVAAAIEVGADSHDIAIEGILVDGRDTGDGCAGAPMADTNGDGRRDTCPPGAPAVGGAWLDLKLGNNVVVRDSEFKRCGKKRPCVQTNPTVQILDNRFTEHYSGPFEKGSSGGIYRGNYFGFLGHGDCSEQTLPDGTFVDCPHYSNISISGGGPWIIERNRFAVQDGGTAVVSVGGGEDANIHDISVLNNIFPLTASDVPGKTSDYSYAIRLAAGPTSVPTNVRIVNNTILGGDVRALVFAGDTWLSLQRDQHPLIANNIFGVMKNGCLQASSLGRWVSNMVVTPDSHLPCAGLGAVGSPNLDSEWRPTVASALVIDAGDQSQAPPTDFYGRPRVGVSDRGAIEFGIAAPTAPGGSGGGGSGGSGGIDLAMTGSVTPISAPAGNSLTWRLRVTDKTLALAFGVYVDVTLPAGVSLTTAEASRGPGCKTTGARTLRCELDFLAASAPVGEVTLVTNVTAPGELVLNANTAYAGPDPTTENNAVVVKANPSAVKPPPRPRVCRKVSRLGNAAWSRLIGSPCRDVLRGGGGQDAIFGLGGRDLLVGGSSKDWLDGGDGGDRLFGQAGDDTLRGDLGGDVLNGGGGSDAFFGGQGNDLIQARDDIRDSVRCGPGRDRVVADRGDRVDSDCERVQRG